MTEPTPGEPFEFRPDADAPGWYIGGTSQSGSFIDIFGRVRMRAESATVARIRFTPQPHHRNVIGTVHGGYIMAVIDQVLFLGPNALGIERMKGAVTIDASTQFFAPIALDAPFDAVVEVLRETGRMVFLRGLIEQAGTAAAAFSGTIRKPGASRAQSLA